MKRTVSLFLIFITFFSCSEHTPKPKGYPRIDRTYVEMDTFRHKAFSFLYPHDAIVEQVKKEVNNGYWFNISYPSYKAIIYCTYLPSDRKKLPSILEDSYQLAYSHALKADGISQSAFTDSIHHKEGIVYDIKGNVAVPIQFYVTDGDANFLRGSLYFDQLVNPDSVAPVVSFIRQDIVSLIESLEWKKSK